MAATQPLALAANNRRKKATVKSISNAVDEFITQHPCSTIRDANAHAKAEFEDEELAAAFVKAWLDRTNVAAGFLGEVERSWPK